MQEEEADALLERAGLALHRGGCGPDQWRVMQQTLLPEYSLQIWAKQCCQRRIFKGKPAPRTLHLYLYDESLRSYQQPHRLLGNDIRLRLLLQGVQEQGVATRAKSPAPAAKPPAAARGMESTTAQDCRLSFLSQQCYENHKRETSKWWLGESGRKWPPCASGTSAVRSATPRST